MAIMTPGEALLYQMARQLARMAPGVAMELDLAIARFASNFEEPPVSVTAPVILTDRISVGDTLTCSKGLWFGEPTRFVYRWFSDGRELAVGTDDDDTYVVEPSDLGHNISCVVQASNEFGIVDVPVPNELVTVQRDAS